MAKKISGIGKYSGYSRHVYKEVVRISQYVEVRDGTRLAVDIYHPAVKGKPISDPLPVCWCLTPYFREDGLCQFRDHEEFIKHGYVLAVVDTRGRGASYGTHMGQHRRWEAFDCYDMTEWFAAQPWCAGNVGMFGYSYMGKATMMAASTRPPHLKAIFTGMHDFDKYSCFYPGGVFMDVKWITWGKDREQSSTTLDVRCVDEDVDGMMLKEATIQHEANVNEAESLASIPYRNNWSQATGSLFWNEVCLSTYLKDIERSGIAIYCYGGWLDRFPKQQMLEFNNLGNVRKLIMAPWYHIRVPGPEMTPELGFDLQSEIMRWFDYWLKGINNGITDEPPIAYYPSGAGDGRWRFASKWPLPQVEYKDYYLTGGSSGSVSSMNDGFLTTEPPASSTGLDEYTVDYTCSSGGQTITDDPAEWKELTPNDEKGLTYTTAPMESDTELTGHPVVHLWITSTARDGDFWAYLEEVDKEGSHYLAYGILRASHRAIQQTPYDNLGLPWHGSFVEDTGELIPGEPVELAFELTPVANIIRAGHRIRLTITCADKGYAALPPELSPPPTVTVYRNAKHTSYITLPFVRG